MSVAQKAIDPSRFAVRDGEKTSAGGTGVPATRRAPRGGGSKRLKNVTLFSRQLAMLVRTGTPLADALGAMERQLPAGPWRSVVEDLHRDVEAGSTLAGAMERHPGYFDSVCRSLIVAGESSGRLDAMLERLSRLLHQQLKVRRSITGALIYPCLLIFVGIAVVILMLCFVLPRFEGLFQTLNAPLPPSTAALLSLSDLLRSYWWVFAAVVALGAVAAGVAASSEGGRRALDSAVVRLPGIGRIARSLLTARFARVLGVLLDSKVPLLEALQLTRNSTGNSLFATLITESENAVALGETVSGVLARSSLIDPYIAEALRHGEQSGQMSPVLLDTADFMDEENEGLVQTLSKLLEPIMLVALGIVVAFIAISLFMPLFDLTSLT